MSQLLRTLEDYELLRRLATRFDLANLTEFLVDYRVSKAGISITRRRRQRKALPQLRQVPTIGASGSQG